MYGNCDHVLAIYTLVLPALSTPCVYALAWTYHESHVQKMYSMYIVLCILYTVHVQGVGYEIQPSGGPEVLH